MSFGVWRRPSLRGVMREAVLERVRRDVLSRYREGQQVFVPSDLDYIENTREQVNALIQLFRVGFLSLRAEVVCGRGHPIWGGREPPPPDPGPCPDCGRPPAYVNFEFFLDPSWRDLEKKRRLADSHSGHRSR